MKEPRSIAGMIVGRQINDLLDRIGPYDIYGDGYKDERVPGLWEPNLGKPSGAGFLLSSAVDGTRTWVSSGGVGIPYPGAGLVVAGSGAWATSITPSTGLLKWTGAAWTWDNTTYLSSLPSHTHGNITNAGAIGSTTGLPIITTTSGVLTVGSFGTTAGTFCAGDDTRFAGIGSIPTQITVANEASDVETFIAFFNSATGNLSPKTNAGIKFNAATGELTVTSLYVTNGIGAGGEINAFAGSAPTDWWDSIPHAAPGTWGAVLPDGNATHFLNGMGGWTIPSGSGVTDHAALTSKDYASAGHTGFQPTLGGTGLVKSTAGTISYIADNSASWDSKVSFPGFGTTHVTAAYGDHNHSGVYQPAGTYSTDIHANITALNAVSGTNTGDNATNSQYSGLVSFPGFSADGVATAGKAVQATDTRLSNARTPTSHNNTYHSETYITSAGSCAYATSAGNSDTVDSQHFSYSNDSNTPTYLWASNVTGTNFLAQRANISVGYATSAGSAPASGGTSSYVTITYNNDSNASYQMLWGSSTSVYGTAGITCNPYTDTITANLFTGQMTVYAGNEMSLVQGHAPGGGGGAIYLNYRGSSGGGITSYYMYNGLSSGYAAVSALNFTATSDRRWKQDIESIKSSPIEIEYKQFRFKSDPKRLRIGVIAQELQLTHPEFVYEDEKGFLAVSYNDLHSKEIHDLKLRISELEKKLDGLTK